MEHSIKSKMIKPYVTKINKSQSIIINRDKEFNLSLKFNSFDPSKSSPPNDFIIKLHERMKIYERNENNFEVK